MVKPDCLQISLGLTTFVIPAKAPGYEHILLTAAATFFPLPLRAVRPAL